MQIDFEKSASLVDFRPFVLAPVSEEGEKQRL